MIQQVNFSIDIMENGKWRIENERKDYVILECPALRLPFIFHFPFSYRYISIFPKKNRPLTQPVSISQNAGNVIPCSAPPDEPYSLR